MSIFMASRGQRGSLHLLLPSCMAHCLRAKHNLRSMHTKIGQSISASGFWSSGSSKVVQILTEFWFIKGCAYHLLIQLKTALQQPNHNTLKLIEGRKKNSFSAALSWFWVFMPHRDFLIPVPMRDAAPHGQKPCHRRCSPETKAEQTH